VARKATERIFLPAVKLTVPEIVDYDLPVAGAFHNLGDRLDRARSFPATPASDAADLGSGMLSLTKGIVVVDANVRLARPTRR